MTFPDFGEPAEGGFSCGHVFGAKSFLGSVDAGTPFGPQQRVVDIDRHGETAMARQPGRGRFDGFQPGEPGPLFDGATVGIEEHPAEGPGEAEAGVVGGAATDAHPAFGGAGFDGGLEDGANAECIEVEGVEAARGKQGESDDLGGFDNGDGTGIRPPPGGVAGLAGGIDGAGDAGGGVEMLGEDGAEAIAAIAHGQEFKEIGGMNRGPTAGDGVGGLMGGEGSLELVRRDEYPAWHGVERARGGGGVPSL